MHRHPPMLEHVLELLWSVCCVPRSHSLWSLLPLVNVSGSSGGSPCIAVTRETRRTAPPRGILRCQRSWLPDTPPPSALLYRSTEQSIPNGRVSHDVERPPCQPRRTRDSCTSYFAVAAAR